MRRRFPIRIPIGVLTGVGLSLAIGWPLVTGFTGLADPVARRYWLEYGAVWIALSGVLMLGGWGLDRWRKSKVRDGIQRRGPELLTRSQFNRRVQGDGFPIRLNNRRSLGEMMRGEDGYVLRIKRRHENRNIITIGDPGSGKTMILMQILDECMRRGEPCFIYDPHYQFVPRYYREDRGDVIMNPLDLRCPSWGPDDDIDYSDGALAEAQALAQATSLFPGSADDKNWFFTRCCQLLWQFCMTHIRPDPSEMAYMMAHCDPLIDEVIKGTELESMVAVNAPQQRGGVVAHLSQIAFALRQLPKRQIGRRHFALREWVQARQGCVFLTNTQDTREALRPIQSLILDSAIRGLMSMGERPDLPPVLMCIDELQTLQKLPQLMPLMTEGRKSLRVALGFHGRSEIKTRYGEDTEAILSAARTRFMLATAEPEAAKWLSESIGEIEVERLRESKGADLAGRSNHTFSSDEPRREPLLLPSEFMGLDDLCGYLKYGNYVVPMEIPILPEIKIAPAFIPREAVPIEKKPIPDLDAIKEQRKEAARAALLAKMTTEQDIRDEIAENKAKKTAAKKGKDIEEPPPPPPWPESMGPVLVQPPTKS